ncbi:MAG: hypothetical protein ACFFDT_06210 [Candidatus Hodarchaeota archaeon]
MEQKGIVEITEDNLPFYFARAGNSYVTLICMGQYGKKGVRMTIIFKYSDGKRSSQRYTVTDPEDYYRTVQEAFMQAVITQSSYYDQTPNIFEKDLRGKTYDNILEWITSTPNLFDHYTENKEK